MPVDDVAADVVFDALSDTGLIGFAEQEQCATRHTEPAVFLHHKFASSSNTLFFHYAFDIIIGLDGCAHWS